MHIHVLCVAIKPRHVTSSCVRLNECPDMRAAPCPRPPLEIRQRELLLLTRRGGFFLWSWQCFSSNSKRLCKNSLNWSPRRAVPSLGVCRYLCPFTSPSQYTTPSSSSSSHGMGRAGKTSLPPHCSCARSAPGVVILVRNEALLQDSAVRCASVPCFIHSLKQPLAGTAQGAPIQPQRTEPARVGKGAGTLRSLGITGASAAAAHKACLF